MYHLGLKTSIQTIDAFVRCMLMGNQPWPQFQNGIRERSINCHKANLNIDFQDEQIKDDVTMLS